MKVIFHLTSLLLLTGTIPALAVDADGKYSDTAAPISVYMTEDLAELDEKEEKSRNEHFDLFGKIELEAWKKWDYEGASSSQLSLGTAEIGFEAFFTAWDREKLVLEWDDSEDTLRIDEAGVTLENEDYFPLYFEPGYFDLPFGAFAGNTIADPLTKLTFELKEPVALLGLEENDLHAIFYLFDDTGKAKEFSDIGYGGRLEATRKGNRFSAGGGIDVISSIFNTDIIKEGLYADLSENAGGGLALHAKFGFQNLGFFAEYMTAFESHGGIKPAAWQLELAYLPELFNGKSFLGLGYSQVKDLAEILPEKRLAITFGTRLFNLTSLAVEYCYDWDYSEQDGGTGQKESQFTLQLTYEF